MIGEIIFIGLMAGLLGLFYRNCLKKKGMIFYPLYLRLSRWVDDAEFCRDYPIEAEEEGYDLEYSQFLGWIAYPLGYCIYCSTTWISILMFLIYMASYEVLFSWHWVLLGMLSVIGISHLVVLISCQYILSSHPDFSDSSYGAYQDSQRHKQEE